MRARILDPRIIVALDVADAGAARALAGQLDPQLCRLKVGFELFVACGPRLVEELIGRGFDVFLDLKFHDIPNTVASACRAAAGLGVWMLTLHAQGGRTMLEAAQQMMAGVPKPPLLIGVTVLTSLDDQDLNDIGIERSARAQSEELAALAQAAGLDGIVCSAHDAASIRVRCGDDLLLVTPGIRGPQAGADDQKRVMTPGNALRAGASFLVVGRPVTRATDPQAALEALHADLRPRVR